MHNFKQKADREFAESVLEVFTAANKKWMSHWKGESDMSPALLELMEPELREAKKIKPNANKRSNHGSIRLIRSGG